MYNIEIFERGNIVNEISTIPLLKKDKIINEIIDRLEPLDEIKKIIIFGSFLKKDNPNDLDLAIFEE